METHCPMNTDLEPGDSLIRTRRLAEHEKLGERHGMVSLAFQKVAAALSL